ncbi:UvrD-helicase domain-containing protein [Hymenobacter yonginensis]|uniref:DNA 3'-5' helicase n=1 Tax=Hymenobacter yonginensis TaxID=748197 RepID=A0ABY7PVC6_9BACT|nr:UvrD-helicase domain-containing protein [Hymenobacter yonginensis]WBO86850.1 UvrD-helicase domain-containing protein [Hymenobacter yonginensis]
MRSIILGVALLLSTPVPPALVQATGTTLTKTTTVYLCDGNRSKVFHLNSDCTGLNNCSTSLTETTAAAARKLGRRACRLASCDSVHATAEQPPLLGYAIGGMLVLLVGFLGYRRHAAASTRNELTTQLRMWLVEMEPAAQAFKVHTAPTAGYFSNYQLTTWQTRYYHLYTTISQAGYQRSNLTALEKAAVHDFLSYHQQGNDLRLAHNAAFIPQEMVKYDHLFSQVEGRSLDVQQRTAIVSDEDNSLVVAGAGSGKTTTIIGKVQYVMDRYGTSPDNILLISFTNKSAATLSARISIEGLQPRTFHKFGKDIIGAVQGKQPSLYDESQFGRFILAAFQQLMLDPAYAEKVTTYFVHHLKPAKPAAEFQNQGEYIQFLKDNNFRSYKRLEGSRQGKKTYRQEIVKSVEECRIANFLLFHGVEYQYEYPYEYDTASPDHAQWKPDFTITQGDVRVYLEHFGVDRDGNVPAFFAKPGQSLEEARAIYWRKIEWARQTSRQYGTALVETFSYEMQEDSLFDNLTANLTRHGIVLRPKTPAEIWAIISQAATYEVTSFQTLLQTFITLMKSNNDSLEDVRRKNEGTPARVQQRNLLFLDLVAPLYTRYQQELATRREIDFSDLISLATSHVRSGAYQHRFDYIIIDEFQDLSQSRYQLIRALKDQNPHCRLFCVGDDWQSIYRFAGSDLSLFKDFSRYFGFTLQSKIERTYRFHEPLITESSQFIMRNPSQVSKALKSGSAGKQTTYRIVYGQSEEQNDTAVLQQVLNELIATTPDIARKEILVLGRYSFDLRRLRNAGGPFHIDADDTIHYAYHDGQGQPVTLRIPFLTVHKSKGLEADIVLVLNCNAGRFGFPSEMSDDPVLSLLLSEADQFENSEERRLFYVALTRAKEHVVLITDPAAKSKFILELEGKSTQLSSKKCPVCITAGMVKRSGTTNGKQWAFYGCTNYTFGCDYREWIRSHDPVQHA